jgi:hypothetical protein
MLLPLLLLTGLAGLSAAAQSRPVPNPQLASRDLNARVEALLRKMTLDEKIGQLAQYSAGYATGPGASNLKYDELVAGGQVGSMLNVVGARPPTTTSTSPWRSRGCTFPSSSGLT